MNELFRKFAIASSAALGTPWMFAANFLLILVWLLVGPLFNFSDTWQLLVNTVTTILTYLAVFLIQNTQNRDGKAIQLKLDEVIRCLDGARNKMLDLENLPDEDLERLAQQFRKLSERENLS